MKNINNEIYVLIMFDVLYMYVIKVVYDMIFFRCFNYNGFLLQCQLVIDVNKFCCKKFYCNFQGVIIEVINILVFNMGIIIVFNLFNFSGLILFFIFVLLGLFLLFLNLENMLVILFFIFCWYER